MGGCALPVRPGGLHPTTVCICSPPGPPPQPFAAYGFEKPSAIQQRAIVPIIKGRDTIAQAQSGTGKTGTFAISILQRLDMDVQECQALILAPTRELAQQIQKVGRSRCQDTATMDYCGAACQPMYARLAPLSSLARALPAHCHTHLRWWRPWATT